MLTELSTLHGGTERVLGHLSAGVPERGARMASGRIDGLVSREGDGPDPGTRREVKT